jgi:hypothetical protein
VRRAEPQLSLGGKRLRKRQFLEVQFAQNTAEDIVVELARIALVEQRLPLGDQ